MWRNLVSFILRNLPYATEAFAIARRNHGIGHITHLVVFKLQFEDHEMGDMTYTMISSGNGKGFGGIWQIPKDKADQIPPHWMGYILVENVEEKLKQAEKAGATTKMPVTKAGDY